MRGIITVNLDTIKANVLKFKRRIGKDTKIIGVVKADGYGHGAKEIAKYVGAIDVFAVAGADEGADLRRATEKPILILGCDEPETAVAQNLTLSVWDKSQVKEIAALSEKVGKKASVAIAVDTGMNRIGVKSEKEFADLYGEISLYKNLAISGVYSHLLRGDDEDGSLSQLSEFTRITERVGVVEKSIAATARATDKRFTMSAVRLGIGMYGYGETFVRPALSLRGSVVRVSRISAGESVGYNSGYIARKPTYIATLSLGYADGISRRYTGGSVIINGKKRKIVGNVCMDYSFAVTDEKTKRGDEVIFIGESGGERITAEDVANKEGTICYEVLTRLKRIERRYVKSILRNDAHIFDIYRE